MKLKSRLFFIIKFCFSFILMYWLFQKKELSYDNVKLGLSNFKLCGIFLLLTFFQLLLASLRTHIFMQFASVGLKGFWRMLSISWASSFIICIAPSSLFGDVFRVKYLMDVDSRISKDNSFYTSIYSKVFSILGLIIIIIITPISSREYLVKYRSFYWISYCAFAVCTLMYLFRTNLSEFVKKILENIYYVRGKTFYLKRLDNMVTYNRTFFSQRKKVFGNLLISLLIQVLNTLSFLVIIISINPDLEFGLLDVISIIPFGIFAISLPISFFGLGVGNVVFSQLLSEFNIPNGADVFTIFFALSYIFNFFGLVPFLKLLKKGRP